MCLSAYKSYLEITHLRRNMPKGPTVEIEIGVKPQTHKYVTYCFYYYSKNVAKPLLVSIVFVNISVVCHVTSIRILPVGRFAIVRHNCGVRFLLYLFFTGRRMKMTSAGDITYFTASHQPVSLLHLIFPKDKSLKAILTFE